MRWILTPLLGWILQLNLRSPVTYKKWRSDVRDVARFGQLSGNGAWIDDAAMTIRLQSPHSPLSALFAMYTRQFVILIFLCSVLLGVLSFTHSPQLPEISEIHPALFQEPRQTPTQSPPFKTTVDDITYSIKPLYEYELYGLIVSRHASDAWWDFIHKDSFDKINVGDLCVVWGDNIKNGVYRAADISFSNGQFSCNIELHSLETSQKFHINQISNNHLLADRLELSRAISHLQIGDQIRIRGYLAEYAHHHDFDFFRGTSITRDDQGDHACETIYVSEVEVLRQHPLLWIICGWAGLGLLLLSIVLWWRLPIKDHTHW